MVLECNCAITVKRFLTQAILEILRQTHENMEINTELFIKNILSPKTLKHTADICMRSNILSNTLSANGSDGIAHHTAKWHIYFLLTCSVSKTQDKI